MRQLTFNIIMLLILGAGSIIMRITHIISPDAFWICICIVILIGTTMSNKERSRSEHGHRRRPFDSFEHQQPATGKDFNAGSRILFSVTPSVIKRIFQVCMLPVASLLLVCLLILSLPVYAITGKTYLDSIVNLADNLTLNLLSTLSDQ